MPNEVEMSYFEHKKKGYMPLVTRYINACPRDEIFHFVKRLLEENEYIPTYQVLERCSPENYISLVQLLILNKQDINYILVIGRCDSILIPDLADFFGTLKGETLKLYSNTLLRKCEKSILAKFVRVIHKYKLIINYPNNVVLTCPVDQLIEIVYLFYQADSDYYREWLDTSQIIKRLFMTEIYAACEILLDGKFQVDYDDAMKYCIESDRVKLEKLFQSYGYLKSINY